MQEAFDNKRKYQKLFFLFFIEHIFILFFSLFFKKRKLWHTIQKVHLHHHRAAAHLQLVALTVKSGQKSQLSDWQWTI